MNTVKFQRIWSLLFASQIPDEQTDPKGPGYHRNANADRKSRGCVNDLQMMMACRQRHRAKDVIGWHQVIGLLGAVGQCFDVPIVIVEPPEPFTARGDLL